MAAGIRQLNETDMTKQERDSFYYMLRDSGREDYAVTVSWWVSLEGEKGNTCTMWGVVKWFDPKSRKIKLANQTSCQWINMEHIFDVHG
ncbi:hypothetical protein BRE01_63560 [Brevibacillus reuszeri]|uniref:YolD-like family protein n=1 Tax=Brevibacillus reuszeri TaxID=54915 RepID=A0A0K9YNM2_9BACL|nr:YolD-like family protein [Brevibacillus reuszeri]KNB70314.1 hypothetical protein ADS79_15240 [Brevibacillus reuszeri]MED1859277.1 YolD-like family protein [Brevibacillus reuszeri]GED72654.1 hypothetical protein BRE01_63560 [Brevibacillus reuszeri]